MRHTPSGLPFGAILRVASHIVRSARLHEERVRQPSVSQLELRVISEFAEIRNYSKLPVRDEQNMKAYFEEVKSRSSS